MANKTENYDYCIVASATHVGCVRKANEDFYGTEVTQNGLVAVVCDGMGGHVGGATASHIAVETILSVLKESYFEDPREAIGVAIDEANLAILDYAAEHSELTGMGSTCVLLILRDAKVYIGHVGDSRIYLARENNLTQLTKDHSYVQMLVDKGDITKEAAEHHPRKNEITNALGIQGMKPATVRENPIELQAGDCFVLCSDGLSGMIGDSGIARVVFRQSQYKPQERANMLIEEALKNGGKDNVTVELVEFPSLPASRSSWLKKKLLTIVALVLVLVAGAVWGIGALLKQDPAETETADTYATRVDASEKEVVVRKGDRDVSESQTITKDLGTIYMGKDRQVMTLVYQDGSLKYTFHESNDVKKTGEYNFEEESELEVVSGENLKSTDPRLGKYTVYCEQKSPDKKAKFTVTAILFNGEVKVEFNFRIAASGAKKQSPAKPAPLSEDKKATEQKSGTQPEHTDELAPDGITTEENAETQAPRAADPNKQPVPDKRGSDNPNPEGKSPVKPDTGKQATKELPVLTI